MVHRPEPAGPNVPENIRAIFIFPNFYSKLIVEQMIILKTYKLIYHRYNNTKQVKNVIVVFNIFSYHCHSLFVIKLF